SSRTPLSAKSADRGTASRETHDRRKFATRVSHLRSAGQQHTGRPCRAHHPPQQPPKTNLAAPPFPYPGTNLDCYTSPRALGITPDSPDVPGPAPTHEGGAEYGAGASGSNRSTFVDRQKTIIQRQRQQRERCSDRGPVLT